MVDCCTGSDASSLILPPFVIPGGSFVQFPTELMGIYDADDLGYLGRQEWLSTAVEPVVLTVFPNLLPKTYGMALQEQCANVGECVPLSLYEIACAAALHRIRGGNRLFEGKVRTVTQIQAPLSHLHTHPLTVIVSYDQKGILRFERGYVTQISDDLGLLVGMRRV